MDIKRVYALKGDLERLKILASEEDTHGKATYEQLNLEDSLGVYRDVLEDLVDTFFEYREIQDWFADMRRHQ